MGYRNDKSRSEQIVEEKKDDKNPGESSHAPSSELLGKKRSSDERCIVEPEEENHHQRNNNNGSDQVVASMMHNTTFQMQQLQASLAAQQHFLEQAAAVQHLTPTLNSLQLSNNCAAHDNIQPSAQNNLQFLASQSLVANSNTNTIPVLGGNPQQSLSAVGVNNSIAISAATNNVSVENNSTTTAPQLLPVTSIPATTVPTTTAAATQSQPATNQVLIPQLTIPHYVPPQPPTWGGQFPALSVQDRPLVPPIYNGINPNYPGAQLLHAHPPIFCVHNFLTSAECDFLIHNANDAFVPAPVVGKGSGEVSPSRTSSTCYLAREDLPEYMRKIALLTGKPPEHCELPQVGRYYPSQQYLQHFDAFDLSNADGIRFASNGGQRTITVLTYLNDVPRGGSTSFPNLNVEVRPQKGMALVFFPATLDGLLDKMALHAAMPAVDVKYVSQVWVRQTNYNGTPSKRLAEPMVGGLQERWEEQQAQQQQQQRAQQQTLLGQFQQHQLHLQQHLQQAQHQHLQQSNVRQL